MKTRKTTQREIDLFLRESNAIEGVFDDESLAQAQDAWYFLMGEDELTPEVMLETHLILMQGKLPSSETGVFRTCDVRVGSHVCMKWEKVRLAIEDWCLDLASSDPIEKHIEYEKIHPFVDGNGRTGRMFMNWMRLKLANEPILVIHDEDKQDYYEWFRD